MDQTLEEEKSLGKGSIKVTVVSVVTVEYFSFCEYAIKKKQFSFYIGMDGCRTVSTLNKLVSVDSSPFLGWYSRSF